MMHAAFIFYSQPNDFGRFDQFRPLADMIRYGRNDLILAESARSGANQRESKPSRRESGNPRGKTQPDAAPTRGGSGAASVHPRYIVTQVEFPFIIS